MQTETYEARIQRVMDSVVASGQQAGYSNGAESWVDWPPKAETEVALLRGAARDSHGADLGPTEQQMMRGVHQFVSALRLRAERERQARLDYLAGCDERDGAHGLRLAEYLKGVDLNAVYSFSELSEKLDAKREAEEAQAAALPSYGIVRIDPTTFTWRLPAAETLAECSEEELYAAIALTLMPPHPVDGGYGYRMLAGIREYLETFLPTPQADAAD